MPGATLLRQLLTGGGLGVLAGVEVGRGLLGMADRVTLVGGELRSGEVDGGGFGVRARIPVDSP